MKDIEIKNISPHDLPRFEEQIRETVGDAFNCPGYEEDVIIDLKAKADPIIKFSAPTAGNDITGFGYGYIAPAATLVSFLNTSPENISASLLEADKKGHIGIIKTIVANPAYQRQGIGTKLVRAIERDLSHKSATNIIVPAWKAGDRINIEKTMNQTGYSADYIVKGLWKEGCDSGAFQCTDRTDKCICSAVFYTKGL